MVRPPDTLAGESRPYNVHNYAIRRRRIDVYQRCPNLIAAGRNGKSCRPIDDRQSEVCALAYRDIVGSARVGRSGLLRLLTPSGGIMRTLAH